MIRTLLLVALLSTPAVSSGPLTIIIDGQEVGTLAHPGMNYDIAAGTVTITTHEIVYGCKQAVVHRDRFEVLP